MTVIKPGLEYLKRYQPDDEGVRFQPLTYVGNYSGLDPVPDGILGDRIMRSRMKSGVMEKVSREDVLRDQFTLDELNDLIIELQNRVGATLCGFGAALRRKARAQNRVGAALSRLAAAQNRQMTVLCQKS